MYIYTYIFCLLCVYMLYGRNLFNGFIHYINGIKLVTIITVIHHLLFSNLFFQ